MKLQTVEEFFRLTEQFSAAEADYEDVLHPAIEQTDLPPAEL